jgi:hypothetical protein
MLRASLCPPLAEPISEDGEISESDDDDDLPSVMKILPGAKGVQARTGLPESVMKLTMTTSR